MKKKIAILGVLAVSTLAAHAEPVSLAPIITSVSAQVTSVITEALPFLGIVLGGAVLFRMARKFIK